MIGVGHVYSRRKIPQKTSGTVENPCERKQSREENFRTVKLKQVESINSQTEEFKIAQNQPTEATAIETRQ